jgi:hypothetical protein
VAPCEPCVFLDHAHRIEVYTERASAKKAIFHKGDRFVAPPDPPDGVYKWKAMMADNESRPACRASLIDMREVSETLDIGRMVEVTWHWRRAREQ